MANVRVTHDKVANAAYVYFDPQVRVNSAHMYLPAGVPAALPVRLTASACA
ncbi:hypothetical protein ACWDZX_10715 [Streptomyces collinus]